MAEITNDYIVEKLKAEFGEDILEWEISYGMLTVTASSEKNVEITTFLHRDNELSFNFFTDLCGIHYPEREKQLGVVCHMHSFKNNIRIRLKFFISEENPHIRTLSGIFATTNWMERETYDFFGIIFDGHPDLRRILNIDEMEVFPLRKEFPLEDPNRHDKQDHFFGR